MHSFKHQTHNFTLTPPTLSLSPLVFVLTHSDIAVYELFTGKLVRKLRGHYGRVTSVVCTEDDIALYSSSSEGIILVWNSSKQVSTSSSSL